MVARVDDWEEACETTTLRELAASLEAEAKAKKNPNETDGATDGDGADAKRAVILFLLFCLFLEALTLAIASKAWRGLTSTIGQQAALVLLGAALLGGTTLLEPPEVPVRGIGEWSD